MPDVIDRFAGLLSSLAVKAPVRVATTANITLSGFQVIDDVTLADGDDNLRVLVKNQNDATTNGIWIAASSVWTRAADFDGNTDVVKGTRVYVAGGATGIGEYVVTAADPILVGTSALTFTLRTPASGFSVIDFGAVGDGVTNDAPEFQAAVDAAKASTTVKTVYVPHSDAGYAFSATVTIPAGVVVRGDNRKGLELSRIKPTSGFTGALFQSEDYGVSRILRMGLEGLFLDGSSTTLTAARFNCQESHFRDLTIKNCFTYGLHIGGISSGASAQALNNHIEDCYLAGLIGVTEFFDGIFLDYFTADTTIENTYIEACKDAGIRSRAYNNKFTNNHIYSVAGTGGGAGVGIYTETSADHDISQNYIELCAAEGILMAGGGSDVVTLAASVHGNVFRNIDTGNTSNGVIEISGSDVSAVSVFGNIVRRDAATAYSTPYFVYFNGIIPTLADVYGNRSATGLLTIGEVNTHNWSGNITQRRIGGLWTDAPNFRPSPGPYTGVNIARFERVFVGAACDNTGVKIAGGTTDWLEDLASFTTANAELAVAAQSGRHAIVCGVRSSDNDTTPSNAIGLSVYLDNDNATFDQNGFGMYIEAWRRAGQAFTTCFEVDINNFGSVIDIDPYTASFADATSAFWCASGGEEPGSPNDASVGIAFVNNNAGFRKGIMFEDTSITGTDGVTGVGTAIAFSLGHKIDWFSAASTIGMSIWSSALGVLNIGGASLATQTFDVEFGASRTGDGACILDLHSQSGSDFDLRINRASGVNGVAQLQQAGTGPMQLIANGAEGWRVNSNQSAVAVSPTGGMGYGTGAGGSVTQATNKTTGVTLNNVCGQITMAAGSIAAAGEATFVLTNSAIITTDVVVVCHDSVGTIGAYDCFASGIGAGSCSITVTNHSAGALDQQIVLNFAIIRAVIA